MRRVSVTVILRVMRMRRKKEEFHYQPLKTNISVAIKEVMSLSAIKNKYKRGEVISLSGIKNKYKHGNKRGNFIISH
jgi:hypothetical protein